MNTNLPVFPVSLSEAWPAELPRYPSIILASSGGADSLGALVWLHSLHTQGLICALRVVSIDHQIHPEAATWSALAVQQADYLNIDAEIIRITLPERCAQGHRSLEARARTARYAALRDWLEQYAAGSVLVTAHHLDDQVETFLLAALRGSGAAGLAAMPTMARFGSGWHWRPFINTHRQALHDLAQRVPLPCVIDPSNQDTHFDRNFLRQEILPLLRSRFPNAIEGIGKTAQHAAADLALLTELAKQDNGVEWGDKIALSQIHALTPSRQANLIRIWAKEHGALMPPKAKLHEFIRQIQTANPAQRPTLCWGRWGITRYRQHIYWRRLASEATFKSVIWGDKSQSLVLDSNTRLHLIPAIANDPLAMAHHWLTLPWLVRPRLPQDTIKSDQHQSSRPLKQWFQENNVPPWARASVMMIEIEQQLAGIVGILTHHPFRPRGDELGWRVEIETISINLDE
ncbi:MAG TPA: tRNA lysidine(34) synthetase TilS [Halothiobacillus sp.]|nr:tRNA lysidine(34) synthetase TilS [Halothiobacillus sp.]